MFCQHCGKEINPKAVVCVNCGESTRNSYRDHAMLIDEASSLISYAGFFRRLGALIIDSAVLGFGGSLIGGIWGFITGFIMTMMGFYEYEIIEFVEITGKVLGGLFAWLYFTLMESSSKQATLGKMVFGIIIVDHNMNRISFGKSNGRYFGKFLSGITMGIGYLMAAFNYRKQAMQNRENFPFVIKEENSLYFFIYPYF